MIGRGSICWAEAPGAGAKRPVVVVQADPFTRSRIPTILVAPLSWNLRLAEAPGNVVVRASASTLPKDAVAVISQLLTLERRHLRETGARLTPELQELVDQGLRLSLGLEGPR